MKSWGLFNPVFAVSLIVCISAHAQQWDWVQRFQGDKSSGKSIALDGSGNIYVAGTFTGTNQLGTNTFVSSGSNDVFIAKLNPEGELAWSISTGGPGDDSIRSLVVTSNGAVFVVGQFAIKSSLLATAAADSVEVISNVFVARIDEGKFSWFDTIPAETNGHAGGVALGEDESLWVIGISNRVFLNHYHWNGTPLNSFNVGESPFIPNGIAVGQSGRIFITGGFYGNVYFGSLSITGYYYFAYFTAALNNTGRVEWAWSSGRSSGANPITGIASTSDGGVISLYHYDTGLPQISAVAVKHSAEGVLLWRYSSTGHWKSGYWPKGVAVDSRGNVHVVGYAFRYFSYYGMWRHYTALRLFTLDDAGRKPSEEFVVSFRTSDRNFGLTIAANAEGDFFITGELSGTPTFGTNVMGAAPGGPNAFIARRSTLQPQLVTQQIGSNIVLSWSRTASPFALQQSDESGSNWFNVLQPPEEIGRRRQVTLPVTAATGLFRLVRTNEVPIRHVPRWFGRLGGRTFLERTNSVVVAARNGTTPVVFGGYAEDLDDDALTVMWINNDTGELLTGATITKLPGADDQWSKHPPYYYASFTNDTVAFAPGAHSVTAILSDGVFTATNSLSFEVISFDTALEELRSALGRLASNAAGRKPLLFLEAALRANDRGRHSLAEKRWRHFQRHLLRQLQRFHSLSYEEYSRLSSAAAQIQALSIMQ